LNWPLGLLIDPPPDLSKYDMVFTDFRADSQDPYVYSHFYSEYGSISTYIFIINYEQSIDYDSDLEMGLNEWYLKHGAEIIPSNSDERINHYREWENYLMDEIVPIKPLYNYKIYQAYWDNLMNYNQNLSLLENWGHLSWDGLHDNQISNDYVVVAKEISHISTRVYDRSLISTYYLMRGSVNYTLLVYLAGMGWYGRLGIVITSDH